MKFKTLCLFVTAVALVASAASVCAQTDENEIFLVAQRAFEDGFYDVAIRYIDQFLIDFPQTTKRQEIQLLLGQCYFFKGQYVKAYEIFKGLLGQPGYDDASLFWLGETYLKGKDYAQARKHYDQLIQVYPSSHYLAQAYYALAWVDFDQSQYLESLKAFETFVEKFPAHALIEDALFRIGECYFHLAQHDKAKEYFEKYVKGFPKSLQIDQAYLYLSEANYYRQDYPQAIKSYTETKTRSLNDQVKMMADIGMGWSYLKLGQFEPARQAFESAQAISRSKGLNSEDPYFALASLFVEQKDLAKALEYYQAIIRDYPKSLRLAEAHLGCANALYALGRYPEAVEAYQAMLQLFGTDALHVAEAEKAYLGLAWTSLKMNQPTQAIEHFQYLVDHSDNKIIRLSALVQIADAYQDLGSLDKAIELYDKILRDFPNSLYADYAQYRQGVALLKSEKIEGAILSLQSLQTNFPNSTYIRDVKYYLGLAYFRKQDWPAAKEQMTDFLSQIPADNEFVPDAIFVLGLCDLYLENYDEAIQTLKRIKKNYPLQEDLVQASELNIAKAYYNKDDVKQSLKEFKLLVYKYPKTKVGHEALLWLGEYYLKVSDPESAIMYYQQFLSDFPQSPEKGRALLALGEAFRSKGAVDEAIDHLKQIDETYLPEILHKARLAIADALAQDLDPDTAVETYSEILKRSPEFSRDVHLKIAELYKKNAELEKALAYYQNALKAPQGLENVPLSEITFMIADCYELLNQKDKAIDEYLKIPYLYTQDVQWIIKAYLRLGRIFEDRENWTEAKSIYEKILGYAVEEKAFAEERLEWIANNTTITP